MSTWYLAAVGGNKEAYTRSRIYLEQHIGRLDPTCRVGRLEMPSNTVVANAYMCPQGYDNVIAAADANAAEGIDFMVVCEDDLLRRRFLRYIWRHDAEGAPLRARIRTSK